MSSLNHRVLPVESQLTKLLELSENPLRESWLIPSMIHAVGSTFAKHAININNYIACNKALGFDQKEHWYHTSYFKL